MCSIQENWILLPKYADLQNFLNIEKNFELQRAVLGCYLFLLKIRELIFFLQNIPMTRKDGREKLKKKHLNSEFTE